MENYLKCVDSFMSQEKYMPLEDYIHKIHLVVLHETYFAVIFRKLSHGNKLLALRIPYLSTCSQMQSQYYEVLEPSAHEATIDEVVFWSGTVKEIPAWSIEIQNAVRVLAEQDWVPGPVGKTGIATLHAGVSPTGS